MAACRRFWSTIQLLAYRPLDENNGAVVRDRVGSSFGVMLNEERGRWRAPAAGRRAIYATPFA